MGVKYYTHFVLAGEAEIGSRQEFSGVVEVNQTTESRFTAGDRGIIGSEFRSRFKRRSPDQLVTVAIAADSFGVSPGIQPGAPPGFFRQDSAYHPSRPELRLCRPILDPDDRVTSLSVGCRDQDILM